MHSQQNIKNLWYMCDLNWIGYNPNTWTFDWDRLQFLVWGVVNGIDSNPYYALF